MDEGCTVIVDENMLKSVIQNLINNSIKFTPEDGKITILVSERDGFHEISVLDTGVGISRENCSKIFSFETLNTTKSTNGEKGTGLGLLICKEFIERTDGKIWVNSELGRGTEFTFTIPK
ncbi:MAG: ATP-binding protein [bacterium]